MIGESFTGSYDDSWRDGLSHDQLPSAEAPANEDQKGDLPVSEEELAATDRWFRDEGAHMEDDLSGTLDLSKGLRSILDNPPQQQGEQ